MDLMSTSRHADGYRETILFTQAYRNIWPHLGPIVRELTVQRPSVAILLLTSAEDLTFLREQPGCLDKPQVRCVSRLPHTIPNLKIAFSMSPDNRLEIPAGFELATSVVKCVLQHGLSDKTVFSEDWEPMPVHDYDVIFLAGPVFREGSLLSYCRKYPDFPGTRTILEAGLCRTDSLIQAAERQPTGSGCGTQNQPRKTIIYAPTCQPSASLERFGDRILEILLKFDGNVILRPHPLTLSLGNKWVNGTPRLRSGQEWRGIFEALAAKHAHVKFSFDVNGDADFLMSDLMISDASGAAYEFMLLDRPVVFIDTPELFNVHGQGGIHYWGREAGDLVSDLNQLMEIVHLNLEGPCKKAAERASLRERLLYNPGHAAELSAKFICDILDNPSRYLKRLNSKN